MRILMETPKRFWLVLLLGGTIGVLFTPGPCHAQILIEQGKVKLSVEPGKTYAGTINVDNTSKEAFDVRVYWEDFKYIAPYHGEKSFVPAGTLANSASSWVTFSPENFKLYPYEKKKVNYTIHVPENTPSGGSYGVLFFEKGAEQPKTDVGIRIVTRVGSLFFLETTNRTKSAQVVKTNIKGANFTGIVNNTGDCVIIAKGVYYIMDEGGVALARGKTQDLYLPPGGKGQFQIPIPSKVKTGTCSIILTFDLEEGQSLVAEIEIQKGADGNLKILNIKS